MTVGVVSRDGFGVYVVSDVCECFHVPSPCVVGFEDRVAVFCNGLSVTDGSGFLDQDHLDVSFGTYF